METIFETNLEIFAKFLKIVSHVKSLSVKLPNMIVQVKDGVSSILARSNIAPENMNYWNLLDRPRPEYSLCSGGKMGMVNFVDRWSIARFYYPDVDYQDIKPVETQPNKPQEMNFGMAQFLAKNFNRDDGMGNTDPKEEEREFLTNFTFSIYCGWSNVKQSFDRIEFHYDRMLAGNAEQGFKRDYNSLVEIKMRDYSAENGSDVQTKCLKRKGIQRWLSSEVDYWTPERLYQTAQICPWNNDLGSNMIKFDLYKIFDLPCPLVLPCQFEVTYVDQSFDNIHRPNTVQVTIIKPALGVGIEFQVRASSPTN